MNFLDKLPKRPLAIIGSILSVLTGFSLTQPTDNEMEVPVSVLSIISPESQAVLQAAQREMEAAQEKVRMATLTIKDQIEVVRPQVEDAGDSIQGILGLFRQDPLMFILAGGAMLLLGDYRKPSKQTEGAEKDKS